MEQHAPQPWDCQDGETPIWYARFLLFRNMPPSARSLLGSVHAYEETRGASKKSRSVPGQWYQRAQEFHWRERAETYDAERRREEEAQLEAERQAILAHGYARMHRRVQKLDELADKLEGLIDIEDRLWLPDVKSVGTGLTAERVDLITFNDALIREYRATLADIAAELGERVKATKQTLSGSLEIEGAKDYLLAKLAQLPDDES